MSYSHKLLLRSLINNTGWNIAEFFAPQKKKEKGKQEDNTS